MATTISTQDIIDAKRDIDDIGKAVNEKVIVNPRYGEDFKSLPMIAAEFQISSDAAEAAAVSAAESANVATSAAQNANSSANIAEAAATAATIGAGVFDNPEAGVDPVTGVADGAYFNVRSSNDESYVDEYQNVGGVATPTGKRYLSALGVQQQDKPASTIKDASGENQQDFNNYIGRGWFNTHFSKGMKILMPNGTPVISRVDNNTIDPSIDFANWMTEGNYVTPDMFGAVGNGDIANATLDTVGLQKAVATGRFVKLTPGKNYLINAEITPNDGAPLVIFGTRMGSSETGSTLTAVSGFTGYMLKPKTGYDIRDIRIVGSGLDGCFTVGGDADSSTGLARIERYYFSNCDMGINFGDKWEHPWGLYYNQIVGLSCRTGGINLGGNSGGSSASSGESAWSMDNILLIASDTAGNTGSGGIEATGVMVTPNVTSTTDKISWNNAITPYFGWCVMRSANGTTNWHVPPNWTSDNFTAGEFTASKSSGETWNYKVIRMTKGLNIRRAKSVNIGVAQCEYFGIGTQLTEVPCATIGESYSESRERTIPLSNFCSIRLNSSALTLNGGWCEKSSYGISVWANSVLSLTGTYSSRNCILGKAQMGGSTQQQMYLNKLNATNGTPDKIVGTGSIYDFAIQEWKYYDDGIHLHVDGANSSGYHVFRRGVQKARLAVEPSGLSVVEADTARINVINKTLTPSFANESVSTALALGSASKFLSLSNIQANASGLVNFDFLVTVRDGSSVARQVYAGTLRVQYVRASTGDVVSLSTAYAATLEQQGTLNSVTFTTVNNGNNVDVYANVSSSLTGTCSIHVVPVSTVGASSRQVAIQAV